MAKVVDVDWDKYNDTFPERYLRHHTRFDETVVDQIGLLLNGRDRIDALDVGCGVNGTLALDNSRVECAALDQCITQFPKWAREVSWREVTANSFDLVVAKNSFNYLTVPQIKCIVRASRGILVFNTFYKPNSGSRRYENPNTGVKGLEVYNYDPEAEIVRHKLVPDDTDLVEAHWFYYYSVDSIIGLLGTEGLEFRFSGPNSLIVIKRS